MTIEENAFRGSLIELLRDAFLNRRSGRVEMQGASPSSIFLKRGDVYLDREAVDAELRQRLSELSGGKPQNDPLVRRKAEELGRRLATRPFGPQSTFRQDADGVVELVGPLPTVCLLLELAHHGVDERDQIQILGGQVAKLRGSNETPALQQLPGLDADMAQAMVLVERPTALGELLRGSHARSSLVRGLCRLWSVGLVAIVEAEDRAKSGNEIVTRKVVQRFMDRIAESLEDVPLELAAERHRKMVADLMVQVGAQNHYQLLGVQLEPTDDALLSAFNKLGRHLHPNHAEKLGLRGKEETLRVLFERATEAYLTLSDPVRRSAYNTFMGLHRDIEVKPEQRGAEKRKMARTFYLRGTDALASMDYSTAVDLLKEAARMDPLPEYFGALGQAQSKNPNWRQHAVGSYARAIELKPDDAGFHYALGHLLEAEGKTGEAQKEYEKTLALAPDHPSAQDALLRLTGGRMPAPGGGMRSLKSVLGWRSGS